MSFGGGGFGGFGSNNNQSSTFGGFGSNNNTNTTTGFGTSASGGFGAKPAGNTMFGSTNNAGGGFGSTGGGFGTTNTGGGFGTNNASTSFGASTSGGGLFGSTNNTTTTGFGGGFGSNTTANTSFGGTTANAGATSSLFGAKPATTGFGSTNTGGSLFGGGTTTTGGFGSNNAAGGFGAGAVGDPPGTAVTPFQAYTEKEPNSANTSNAFQNILFQDPYKKWSADELRLTDYAQGRKHGNASGAGAFGVGSGFGGGFGSSTNQAPTSGFGTTNTTSGGIFGGGSTTNTTTGTGFGQSASTGFGSSTSGGIFGQNKPAATGGLFGNNTATTAQPATGGLFGSGSGTFGNNTATATTNTGFGSSASGGLFGNNQAKPAGTGFSFGNTNTTTNTTGGFGTSASTGFGATNTAQTGGGLFGNTAGAANTGNSLFGSNTAQAQPASGFGGGFGQTNTAAANTGGGLFGAKPATGNSLFGASTTTPAAGGGLFGTSNAAQPAAGGAFGQTNTAGGGLFGAKPATGGGLFGSAAPATNTTTGGGLFGASTAQPAAGGGLFGSSTAQAAKPGGLFGAPAQSTGGGLFGQPAQNQGSSLFGGSTQNQGQNLGGSLLGASQGSQAPQGLTANLNDVSAYGTPGLFAGLGGQEVADPGPLATPINGNAKPRKSAILPLYKLAPASASRYATPQKRGFGFSYSSYGTPGGSPASVSGTPNGLGRSLLGSSSSGSLSKSMSTNNLRRAFNAEDSILAPGAFSSSNGARWYGSTGSKKLVINREIRSDLFSTPQKDKQGGEGSTRKLAKRVSFDTNNGETEEATPVRAALPALEEPAPAQGDETPRQNKTTVANGSATPEMEQVKGNELAIVHEEENAATSDNQQGNGFDNAPGQYWMQPTREELQSMNRIQRQKIDGFTVGRDNVGYIKFKIPVDISGIDMDELCGGIIQLEPRSATVYPVSAKKPPVGKGLNVPAQIALEQSWPRGGRDKRVSSDPKRFNKHVERLKRIPDTTFQSYDKDTGVWIFSVEHFTTYGLDESDDETDAEMDNAGVPPAAAAVPAVADETPKALRREENNEFRQPRGLPGAFDDQEDLFEQENPMKQSFLGVSSADFALNDVQLSLEGDDVDMGAEYDMSEDEDLARPSTGQHHAAELDENSPEETQVAKRGTPGGILRARMRAVKDSAGPVTLEVADGDDWAEMLRKTVSPVKRDRHLLRELNESPSKALIDFAESPVKNNKPKRAGWGKARNDTVAALASDKNRGFATSIDLMNSLFEKPKPTRENLRASVSANGFPKWPYQRTDKSLTVEEEEKSFHDVLRPTWGPDEVLVAARPLGSRQFRQSLRDNDILVFQRSGIQTDGQDVRLAKFATQSSKKYLRSQDNQTKIALDKSGLPFATLSATAIKELFHHQEMNDPASIHEKRIWELASILFDKITSRAEPEYLIRKKNLSEFWTDLVEQASSTAVGLAGTSEEKAVACLAGHRVTEACKHLLDGKNFRLGTLVPMIGSSDSAKRDMKEQLKTWQASKMLSEFSEAIRTICELLSGNVCVCEGMKSVPIEDRLESFVIARKFGLDWRQSFGLRLWYALNGDDDAKLAVSKFQTDIEQDREDVPAPWYVEQGIPSLGHGGSSEGRQDLLWGLLQLYANPDTHLDAILQPENSQLSPIDMRVCWQLGQALLSKGGVSYGQDGNEKADAVTIAYAAQLTSAGEWLEAIFVLLHLLDADARKQAIQEHLCRHAGLIGPESDSTFSILTNKFLLPTEWVWEALALYMRSVKKDASAEVHCLLRAGSFVEAHRVLVNQVAPQAIVERDYASLSELIGQFEEHGDSIPEWSLGGEIYRHFLALMEHRARDESASSALLERLLSGLNAMNEQATESEIIRFAAISDMADETAREILKVAQKKQDSELRTRVLHLPLTQDRLLAYSVDIGLDRFREVMSH